MLRHFRLLLINFSSSISREGFDFMSKILSLSLVRAQELQFRSMFSLSLSHMRDTNTCTSHAFSNRTSVLLLTGFLLFMFVSIKIHDDKWKAVKLWNWELIFHQSLSIHGRKSVFFVRLFFFFSLVVVLMVAVVVVVVVVSFLFLFVFFSFCSSLVRFNYDINK